VRFSPKTPPAFSEIRNTGAVPSLNDEITAARLVVVPSRVAALHPGRL